MPQSFRNSRSQIGSCAHDLSERNGLLECGAQTVLLRLHKRLDWSRTPLWCTCMGYVLTHAGKLWHIHNLYGADGRLQTANESFDCITFVIPTTIIWHSERYTISKISLARKWTKRSCELTVYGKAVRQALLIGDCSNHWAQMSLTIPK